MSLPTRPRLLITGATGFLGRYVLKRALAEGYPTASLGRSAPEDVDIPHYDYHGKYEDAHRAVHGFAPDAVLHLATKFVGVHHAEDVDGLVAANITFGLHLLEALRHSDCHHFINAASAWQYLENQPFTPNGLYAASKCAFDALMAGYIREGGLHACNLVIYESYGAGDTRPKLVPKLLQQVREGHRELPLIDGQKGFYFTHADDIARAFLHAVSYLKAQAPTTHLHVALRENAPPLRIHDMIEAMQAAWPVRLEPQYGAFPTRPNEVLHPPDGLPILPGWQPQIPLVEGLRAMWPASDAPAATPASSVARTI